MYLITKTNNPITAHLESKEVSKLSNQRKCHDFIIAMTKASNNRGSPIDFLAKIPNGIEEFSVRKPSGIVKATIQIQGKEPITGTLGFIELKRNPCTNGKHPFTIEFEIFTSDNDLKVIIIPLEDLLEFKILNVQTKRSANLYLNQPRGATNAGCSPTATFGL